MSIEKTDNYNWDEKTEYFETKYVCEKCGYESRWDYSDCPECLCAGENE